MGILEGLVIATIVLAAAYVGYAAWQESLESSDGEGHDFQLTIQNIDLTEVFSPNDNYEFSISYNKLLDLM